MDVETRGKWRQRSSRRAWYPDRYGSSRAIEPRSSSPDAWIGWSATIDGVNVGGFDHLVLRCGDVETTLAWYVRRLDLEPVRVEQWRTGEVPFPSVRVDAGTIIDLVAAAAEPLDGRLDHICLVVDEADLDRVLTADPPFEILEGPVERFGARGVATSVYVRDPDGLVVELRSYP